MKKLNITPQFVEIYKMFNVTDQRENETIGQKRTLFSSYLLHGQPQMKSYKNSEKNLLRNIIDDLNSNFGEPNKALKLEFNTKVWILKYKDLTFNVFTSKGGGTSIELCNYSDEQVRKGEREEDIIDFLTELHKKLTRD